MPTSTMPASADPAVETRRQVAVDFLEQASSGSAHEAMRRYTTRDFVHHNAYFPSDAESLATAMDDNARANPQKRLEVLRTVAEGPLVAVHSRVRHQPSDEPFAVVHLFRFEGEQIAELWDLAQASPPDSPNELGMF